MRDISSILSGLSEPTELEKVTDPFHNVAFSALAMVPDDEYVELFQVTDDSELSLARIATDRMCEPDEWKRWMCGNAEACELLAQIIDGLDDADLANFGERIWGFGYVQRTWSLPRDLLQAANRRWMDPRHHPDRVPEISVVLMLHDHRLIMVSAPVDRPALVTELPPLMAEGMAAEAPSVGSLMKAVDRAAQWCRDTGRILKPTAEVVYP